MAEQWIEDVEIENAQIKWAFSHFDGREAAYNDEGDHNFQIILSQEQAMEMTEAGWNVKEMAGREEGDPPEYLLKVKISYRFEKPAIYFLKGERRFLADQADLADIKRENVEQIDVIVAPRPWVHGRESGVSAYAKEMYVKISESRFAAKYADYTIVR